MFIDHVTIEVRAGDGGDGCVAFRREKFVPRGGPCGGDGGHGGSVTVRGSEQLSSLLDLHRNRHFKAGRGEHGKGKSMKGKDGDDVVIAVPPGTEIRDADTDEVLGEVLQPGDEVVVARGGKGGLGNEKFKSSGNRAPRQFTYGGDGEERRLTITLKLIADVGLVGEPNAGKSTLISAISAAHPKVADYPFTTKTPVLGIVRAGDFDTFVMVDIPGLIEGAHKGKGMGRDFLRHIERCRVILWLVDGTREDAVESYHMLRNEVMRYDPTILERPSMLVVTKQDAMPGEPDSGLLDLHDNVAVISAVARMGVEPLVMRVKEMLQ